MQELLELKQQTVQVVPPNTTATESLQETNKSDKETSSIDQCKIQFQFTNFVPKDQGSGITLVQESTGIIRDAKPPPEVTTSGDKPPKVLLQQQQQHQQQQSKSVDAALPSGKNYR